jgi:hypothetical protein
MQPAQEAQPLQPQQPPPQQPLQPQPHTPPPQHSSQHAMPHHPSALHSHDSPHHPNQHVHYNDPNAQENHGHPHHVMSSHQHNRGNSPNDPHSPHPLLGGDTPHPKHNKNVHNHRSVFFSGRLKDMLNERQKVKKIKDPDAPHLIEVITFPSSPSIPPLYSPPLPLSLLSPLSSLSPLPHPSLSSSHSLLLFKQTEVVTDVYYFSPTRLERKSTSNVDDISADPPDWATVAWVNVDGMGE